MIPPLSLFNVSRYKRRDTEKRVNKNVQMSALCHSAMVTSQLSARGIVILFVKMNSYKEVVKPTGKEDGRVELFASLNFNLLMLLHLSFLKEQC